MRTGRSGKFRISRPRRPRSGQSLDSPGSLVNIASAMKVENDAIADIRVACGGVACVPLRLTVVEEVVKGSLQNGASADLAASAASRGATPLNYNGFKIPLMENLVKRAIRES